MFNKKKFRLVEKENKMFGLVLIKNIKWRNCALTFGLTGFALLLIFGNLRSESFYVNKAAKKEMLQNDSQVRSIEVFQLLNDKTNNCKVDNYCVVTCSGVVKDLKNNQGDQNLCYYVVLRINDGIFPEEKLQSNWLKESFNPTSIHISRSKVSAIQDGAFNQPNVFCTTELELNDVQLTNLTDRTFDGLRAIETFTLVNKIENFSGEAFLKPMMKTLKKLVIKHVTSIATDPGPWLRGENFPKLTTIILDGSNFGGYINAATFGHFKKLSTIEMNSCKITSKADGSFDFMNIQMVLLISLQNNLLKRLDGDYLSTINFLRRLNLQNNPWDCTCEIKHLASVIIENPDGFGEIPKCSTPPHLDGNFLNEIDVGICEDEPSPPLEITLSTALHSSYTVSANLTDLLTTTEILHQYTTPSPQNRTTTLAADSIFVQCARQKVQFTNNYPPNVLELSPPDGRFKIVSVSGTTVRMTFEGLSNGLAVIWFYEQQSSGENGGSIRIVGEFNIGCQTELDTSLVVEDLIVNQSYIFCLIKNGTKVISPFNCQSHFSTVRTVDINDTIWLRKKDMPIIICVFVASIVVSILVGLLSMYFLIRYYPCLLRGGRKQIEVSGGNFQRENEININRSVTETSFENSFLSQATTANFRRFSTESSLSYMMANNYEELDYYKRMTVNNDLILSNRVPRSPAPPLPKRSSDIFNQKVMTLYQQNHYLVEQKIDDNGYTSVV